EAGAPRAVLAAVAAREPGRPGKATRVPGGAAPTARRIAPPSGTVRLSAAIQAPVAVPHSAAAPRSGVLPAGAVRPAPAAARRSGQARRSGPGPAIPAARRPPAVDAPAAGR